MNHLLESSLSLSGFFVCVFFVLDLDFSLLLLLLLLLVSQRQLNSILHIVLKNVT